MIIFSLPWYVSRRLGQNEAYLLTENLSDAKRVILVWISQVHVVDAAQKSHLLNEFAHCDPPLLAKSQRPGGLNFIHYIFSFMS